MNYLLRLYIDARLAVHFFVALRTSDHAKLLDRIESASAMMLTRAIRRNRPELSFPVSVVLEEKHARDIP